MRLRVASRGSVEGVSAPFWLEDRAELQDIRVTKLMLLDHFPPAVVHAVGQCLRDVRAELRASEEGGGKP